jgi:hypothetical protein
MHGAHNINIDVPRSKRYKLTTLTTKAHRIYPPSPNSSHTVTLAVNSPTSLHSVAVSHVMSHIQRTSFKGESDRGFMRCNALETYNGLWSGVRRIT